MLAVLLRQHGEAVTREELRAQIWPQDTFVDFDNSLNTAINKLRDALGDSADNPRFIETLPRRGYRFLAPITSGDQNKTRFSVASWKIAFSTAAVALFLTIVAAVGVWRSGQAQRLNEKDTIVLADFTNTTGDPVFDDTLKQGLRIQLEQSPFLNIVSDQKLSEELRMMRHNEDERLTLPVARDVCQRAGSKVVVAGTISSLGSHYVIGLNALNCQTGDVLASEQSEADRRERVLMALSESATNLRKKLGESLASIQKYDVPLEQATTPSLEALKAYSIGLKTWWAKGETAGFPLLERAVELDPKFAMAYARMGVMYGNLWEEELAIENIRIAFELRENTSARERLFIESQYYGYVIGDMEKAAQLYQVRTEIYPRDFGGHNNLANTYLGLGKCQQGLQEALKAMQLDPGMEDNYITLADSYLCLSRLNDAETTLKQADERRIESEGLVVERYLVAFLKGDEKEMKHLATASGVEPSAEGRLMFLEELAETYHGRLRNARLILRASMNSAKQHDLLAIDQATLSLMEAYFGDARLARADANLAVKWAPKEYAYSQAVAALALALTGDAKRATQLADELNKSFPLDTQLQSYLTPSIRAAIAMGHNDAAEAVELLRVASPYDLGTMGSMDPVYLRGQAYLALGNDEAAAAEFQKVIDHPGIVGDSSIGSLARLGLARSYALHGDTAKARTAFQDFFTLWKDADPDIPVLKQAKAEYAKLQ